jgi:hypothetical protein
MKTIYKFILLFLTITLSLFLMYKIGWSDYMTNGEYLLMGGGISLFFSGLIVYGDKINKQNK